MFNKLIGPVLVGFLVASAVFNLWASVRYFFTLRETYKFQAWFQHINNTLSAAQALANEAVRYSERNAAIDPILLQFDLKPKTGPVPQPSAPATPPSSQP